MVVGEAGAANDCCAPPSRRAVITKATVGTDPAFTRPCASVTPWKNWFKSFDTPTQTVAFAAGWPPRVTVIVRPLLIGV
jgi:hypothetical protein